MENRESKNNKVSRKIWKVVETEAREVRIEETKRERKKKRRRKKEKKKKKNLKRRE